MGSALTVMLAIATPIIVWLIGTADPYRFWINDDTTTPIRVWYRGERRAVERMYSRGIRVHGTPRIILAYSQHTQYRMGMEVNGSASLDGIKIYLRTTEHDLVTAGREGITCVLDRHGIHIQDGSTLLAEIDTLRYDPSLVHKITIDHIGSETRIALGCTVLGPFRTNHPATSQLIIEPIGSNDATLNLREIAVEETLP